jgi:glucokinase
VILAGDVGGTKTALALFEPGASGLVALREAALPSREFPTFEKTLAAFLGDGPPAWPPPASVSPAPWWTAAAPPRTFHG